MKKKGKVTGMLKLDCRGIRDKHAKVSDEKKNGIISDIDSFPVIEAHYCRAKTNKIIWKQGLALKRCTICAKKNASDKTSLGSNLLTTVISIFTSQKQIDVKNARRSRLRKVKIYQLALKKRTVIICT